MDNPIPESVKKTWDNWNIRGVILFSLLLQTVLILLAPLRKGMGYKLIILLIWSAYFLADSAATFAIGLIAERAINSQTPTKSNELLVLWAPFLLLHLGGPDTITAVALEDNELWLRQLFGLIFQAGFTFYVFLLSLPGNKLFVPTILVFIAGIIKCFERTRAMYLASWEKFRESTIIELAKDVKVNQVDDLARLVSRSIHYTCEYFQIFRGIVVDLFSNFTYFPFEEPFSFGIFGPEDGLRIIKFICFGSLVAALSVFYFQVEKHGLNDFDLGVTYTLFLGGIALDVISFFMGNFSEWTFAALRNHHKSCIARIIRWFLNLKSSRWQQSRIGGKHGVFVFATPFLPRRWSGSVSGLSVIKAHQSKRYGIDKIFQYIAITTYRIIKFLQIDKIIACFGLADFANEIRIKTSLSQEPLTKELWVFIFNEIKRKSKNGDEIRRKTESGQDPEINDPEVGTIKIPNFEYDLEADIRKGLRKLFSAKGDCTLKEMDTNCDLIQFVEKVNFSFGKSIIFWHIATEFLYEKTAKEAISDEETYNAREFSKILSDYMFYLLVLKPTMMNSKENVGLETLRDEAKFRFQGKISPATRAKLNSSVNSLPVDQAERMVDKLQMSKVWVELISYAAYHSRSTRTHVEQVSNGGELFTFVWVLMAHFGLLEPKSED
ncbi:DUF4220 domain-containing protein [Citrus sinensis]|uniref:DUF4220 domain-containing protein n=2 Tax=Citrus TaxID=2706 RepID=V4UPA6_CITCL|nr:hypothetical protein CICLE_v10027491mg [Citrus x clementina]KAH9669777.1 DUF4220 domain-containing protein [Citrus sinensis]